LAQKIRAWALSTVEDHSSCLHLAKAGVCHHHTSCFYNKTLYQAGKQTHQRTNQNQSMKPTQSRSS